MLHYHYGVTCQILKSGVAQQNGNHLYTTISPNQKFNLFIITYDKDDQHILTYQKCFLDYETSPRLSISSRPIDTCNNGIIIIS